MAVFLKTQPKKTGIFLKSKTPLLNEVKAQPSLLVKPQSFQETMTASKALGSKFQTINTPKVNNLFQPTQTKVNTADKVANFLPNLLANIFVRGPMRSGAAVVQTAARYSPLVGPQGKQLVGEKFKPDESASRFEKIVQQEFFGGETKDFVGEGQALGIKNKPTAFAVGGVLSALDFTGAGGEKNAIKALASTSKADDVFRLLKQINVADDIAKDYAPIIAKTAKEAEVVKLVDRISELQKTTKTAPKTAIIPKDVQVDPLLSEARKYKSAEEFVSKMQGSATQYGDYTPNVRLAGLEGYENITKLGVKPDETITIYRGIDDIKGNLPRKINDGDFVTTDFDSALSYAGSPKDVVSMEVKAKDLYVSEPKDFKAEPFYTGSEYVYTKKGGSPMTKSQLTDIWKKANETEIPKVRANPIPLATKIENAYTNLAKLGYEKESIGAKFDSTILEGQYQKFKKFVPIKKLDEIEDAAQFKTKVKAEPKEIDNMLYSQELTDSDVFDMFKERRFRELSERGLKGEIKQQESLVKKDLTRLEKIAKIRSEKQQFVDRIKTAYKKKVEKINTAKDILDNRRSFIKAVQKQFGLSDNDLKSITQRDIRLMSNLEFKTHLDNILVKSEQLAEKRQLVNEVQDTIQKLELQKVENLQEALKLPSIAKMSPEQLGKFNETLNQFKKGDEFLTVRKLQTVDNTDLKGIRTLREAKERLAKELGVDVSKLDNVKVEGWDRFLYDTALAEKNPFYGLMVNTVNKSILNAEARFLQTESKINSLINAARKSRKQGIIDRFVPQDKQIFQWLESPDEIKKTLDLTNEELEAAQYIQKQYADMRDYLVQFGTLKKYRQDYITHINRGFLEEWKETSLLGAMKNVFKQYQKEEAIFNIIDDTGKILPLEKFFQFSMRRTGKIAPTQNVANAFLSYLKAFEKKSALDSVVPKLDIYAHSLTPKIMTPRGLEFDRSLKTFVNEWINTKKGRTAKIVGVEQGGKADLLLRAGKALTTTLDLGLNIPVGIAARAGENMTNFVNLGAKKYALGLIRARTAQGKRVAASYKNFIGRTPFNELSDASKGLGDKLFASAFGLFKDATVRSNKTFLLGSLTDQEYKTGLLSIERLALLKSEMGRYRVVEGAKSIVGSTSLGGILTQYKSWAIPVIRTTLDNLSKLAKNPSLIKQREGQELLRATLSTLGVVFAYKAFVGDEEDKSFLGTVLNKAYRDATTLVGALDPKTITATPRLATFLADLGKSVFDIDTLERTLTPRLVKQFIPKEKPASENKSRAGLPKLPKLPKIK